MRSFLFDVYGTLVDVKTDENSPAFKKSYAKYFKKISPETDFWQSYERECENLKTDDEYAEPDIFEVFQKIAPDVETERLRKAAYTFRKASRSRLRLYKGARRLLIGLKKRGAKIYIVSNAQTCFTLPELKKLRIYGLFDGVELSSEFGYKKPCGAFFGHAIEKYGLDKGECVYCGNDFNADVKGAKGVGIATAYIKSNISPEDDDLNEVKKVSNFATDDYRSFIAHLLSLCDENKNRRKK